jgi:DNA-binding NarL/FixJ family response regulator
MAKKKEPESKMVRALTEARRAVSDADIAAARARGQRARVVRSAIAAGMTESEIGRALGISHQAVGKILRG